VWSKENRVLGYGQALCQVASLAQSSEYDSILLPSGVVGASFEHRIKAGIWQVHLTDNGFWNCV